MVVGYALVSARDQNLQTQRDALEQAGCEKIFVEKSAGAQQERPQLNGTLECMREGDILVVWKLDRLACSVKQLIETVECLRERGIDFRSTTESIDTTSTDGWLILHIFGSLSEFKRSMVRESTRVDLTTARARGRMGGRLPSLTKGDIAEAEAMLRDPHITVADVAQRLNVAQSTLYRHMLGGRSRVATEFANG